VVWTSLLRNQEEGMTTPARVRCAIYTRKSSEEGLEQSFNSLDAQREACEAYIVSQGREGWQLIPTQYDYGGFSGGNMERPALKRLLRAVHIACEIIVMGQCISWAAASHKTLSF
jgi:hypothetical protein